MAPFAYVPFLNERYKNQGFPPYQWSTFDSAPWTPLRKPLSECKVAIVSSGGLSRHEQRPFAPFARNDLTVLELRRDTRPEDVVINHGFYDHCDADKDPACVFPLWALLDLEAEGFIGSVAETHFSGFMGRIYSRTPVIKEKAPAVCARMRQEGVDAALLVPA